MSKFSGLATGVFLRGDPARTCDHPFCSRRAGYWIRVRGAAARCYCDDHAHIAWDRLWAEEPQLMEDAEAFQAVSCQDYSPDYTRDCGNL